MFQDSQDVNQSVEFLSPLPPEGEGLEESRLNNSCSSAIFILCVLCVSISSSWIPVFTRMTGNIYRYILSLPRKRESTKKKNQANSVARSLPIASGVSFGA